MRAARHGHPGVAITLLKAKANINDKNKVCIGLAGWMVVVVCVCVEVKHPLGFGIECAGTKMEMSRECCCSVSHADVHHVQEGLGPGLNLSPQSR